MPINPADLSSIEDCVSLYERGFAGAYKNPAAESDLVETIESRHGYAAASLAALHGGFENSGHDVLCLPFLPAMRMYPDCLPGPPQARGDCVSWTNRTALLVSYTAGLWFGGNDEKFGVPVVSDAARKSCVFASENMYWFRGHSGEGWDGASSARIILTKSGLMVRKDYPEIGINLENYSAPLAGKWGATPPPENIVEVTKANTWATATVCKTWDDVRNMLSNGFAIASTGSEAWEKKRDEFGYSSRSRGTWYHALAYIAVDDRPEVRSRYGCKNGGLVLIQNSWGRYNGDSCPIFGSKHKIPPGSFWARWDDIADRYAVAFSGPRGFSATPLPQYSLSSIL
jgi:hypothetical protein